TQINLFAKDPLNANVSTGFNILAFNGATVNNNYANTAQVIGGVLGGAAALAMLIGTGLGFWRFYSNRSSQSAEQFADLIRKNLNLKGVDNFDSTTGRKYVRFVYALQDELKGAGMDINPMSASDLQNLVKDIGDAARNKISPATDCLG